MSGFRVAQSNATKHFTVPFSPEIKSGQLFADDTRYYTLHVFCCTFGPFQLFSPLTGAAFFAFQQHIFHR